MYKIKVSIVLNSYTLLLARKASANSTLGPYVVITRARIVYMILNFFYYDFRNMAIEAQNVV